MNYLNKMHVLTILFSMFLLNSCGFYDIESLTVSTNLLVKYERKNGERISNFSKAILNKYGFLPQTLTYAIPELAFKVLSSPCISDSVIKGKVVVRNWNSASVTVVNDLHTIPFTASVIGTEEKVRCADKSSYPPAEVLFKEFEPKIAEKLKENTVISIADKSKMNVKPITPSKTSFKCLYDKHRGAWGRGVTCSGSITFVLE